MQVIGVASAGSTGVRSVTALVAEPRVVPPPATAADESRKEPSRLRAEAVVFPRARAEIDARPDEMRREHAARRYASDGDPRARRRR